MRRHPRDQQVWVGGVGPARGTFLEYRGDQGQREVVQVDEPRLLPEAPRTPRVPFDRFRSDSGVPRTVCARSVWMAVSATATLPDAVGTGSMSPTSRSEGTGLRTATRNVNVAERAGS